MPILIYLDEDDPRLKEYDQNPPNPAISFYIGKAVGLGGVYHWVYENFPQEKYYGFLGDDLIPQTDGWDEKLVEAAGDWNVAYPNDKFWEYGELATHPTLGGELVRHMGWLCYPGLERTYIDTVWHAVGTHRGALKWLPDVILEHMHPLKGKAPMDDTYAKIALHTAHDASLYQQFMREFQG